MPTYKIQYGVNNPEKKTTLKDKFEVEIWMKKSVGRETPVNRKSKVIDVSFVKPEEEESVKNKLWIGTNYKNMNVFDRTTPNANLENFVRGSFIHQILDMKDYPKMVQLYRNDRINFVKLAIDDVKFHKYLQSAAFIPSYSFKLELFLKQNLDSIDYVYSFRNEHEEERTYKLVLLIKEKDMVHTNVYTYDSQVEIDYEKRKMAGLSQALLDPKNSNLSSELI